MSDLKFKYKKGKIEPENLVYPYKVDKNGDYILEGMDEFEKILRKFTNDTTVENITTGLKQIENKNIERNNDKRVN